MNRLAQKSLDLLERELDEPLFEPSEETLGAYIKLKSIKVEAAKDILRIESKTSRVENDKDTLEFFRKFWERAEELRARWGTPTPDHPPILPLNGPQEEIRLAPSGLDGDFPLPDELTQEVR